MAPNGAKTDPKPDGEETDPIEDALAGKELDAQAVRNLEVHLSAQPNDLSARTKLLGYYFGPRRRSIKASAAQKRHVLWIINNRPAAMIAGLPYCTLNPQSNKEGCHAARKLWLPQTKVHPDDANILGNASKFFFTRDPEIAEQLLLRAQTLEPLNTAWCDSLGQLNALDKRKNDSSAAKSLAEFERAQAAEADAFGRYIRLEALAKAAFAAREIEKAHTYATALLATALNRPKDWNYGNAIHSGNIVLGRIALKQGDLQIASEFLLKAGRVPGSPSLNSFGPNMSLARELLEKGEREVVLQYLDLCRKFWRMGGTMLDSWTAEVKSGAVPKFGGNLVY